MTSVSNKTTEPTDQVDSKDLILEQDEIKTGQLMAFQSNSLIRDVRRIYSLNWYKALIYLVAKVAQTGRFRSDLPVVVCSLKELCAVIGVDPQCRQNVLRAKKMILSMTDAKNASFSIRGDKGWEMPLAWLENVFIKKQGSMDLIAVRLNSRLAPFYLQLNSHYTKIDATISSQLSSKYSMFFYELCKEIQFRGSDTLSLDWIREMLNIKGKSYQNFSNLEQSVLDPAFQEIRQKTDLDVRYSPVFSGTKVVAVLVSVSVRRSDMVSEEIRLWRETLTKYKLPIAVERAEAAAIEEMLQKKDQTLYYSPPES